MVRSFMRTCAFAAAGVLGRGTGSRTAALRENLRGLRLTARRKMHYLDAKTAAEVDELLMGSQIGFTLEQLMELAGLAVAQAVADFCPSRTSVLVVAGPGNNGGDGLVAGRHLQQFGYSVKLFYPKQGKQEHYKKLVKQLEAEGIEFVPEFTDADIILDSIFGFSFKGSVRDPFVDVIKHINASKNAKVICVDVPSGWDVDGKDSPTESVRVENPACVISLTAPKEAVRSFKGPHYVGGRFVPRTVVEELEIDLVQYDGEMGIKRIS
eukprot:Plantae.Rhodophyta-Purpureofilum_apyrenoidigerum.ctg23052.p1 GENE.Plantae.Rhodophyta-Purpureofilum_apyrenoidigerum.ctg23052~~Plantae.Rhodophyta-Purpureofilum_apyrenoidigerum.ctg23052.p1  ORF type:complete len:267 (+),score=45.27 Plantae.Rhodophyta-Purpureofilum_apyrenoidigerum.ctg23052:63-863(+)